MGYDAYFHTKIADIIMFGFCPPFEISGKYVYAPIVHLNSNVGTLCHIPVKYAVFLSIGVGSVISTLFLYIIGKNIAGPQIGLLAALLANLTNDLIAWASRILPRIPGDMLFIGNAYLIFTDTIHIDLRTHC